MSGFVNAVGLVASALAIIEFASDQFADKKAEGASIRIKGMTVL
jgi:hypothetical protein